MTPTYSASIKYLNLSRKTAINLIDEYTFHLGFNSLRRCRRLRGSIARDTEHMRDFELAEAIVTAVEVISDPSIAYAGEYSVFHIACLFEDNFGNLDQPFHVSVGKASAIYPRH